MDSEELMARLQALEAAQKVEILTDSFWVVYDPSFVRIWCPKSACPNLGRKLEVETIKIKASEAQGLTEDGEVKDLEGSDDTIIESKVVIDKGPQKSHHPLGVIAAFKTENEAHVFTKKYYKANQDRFAQMDRPPALELIEIKLTS
ncbi:MAG: hypothetical protein CBB67_004410 [Alteromonadaceae bacterium TMED7]|uniref:hypothetical protein n=1 Tax=Alteromonas sp. TaxID=232 RepID=UPI000B6F4C9A|nr:hypothetical protein [Alteromonas sp.]MAI37405.1 hypothetical protein [Alteromonas sp.]RPH21052.1 MAG: hypothetical protein CBB67_004410 [Alteromonadaceae bacterium TMED7]|tara:strand:- start:12384 stop:12821 length:438 start_codon:yes stop_codon:yes gene_type:complete